MHVDHIGIATEDVDEFADRYETVFGFDVVHEETFGGMKIAFLDVDGTYFELLEPIEADTTIGSYLDSRGPGMHHVAFAVDSIDAALERASDADVRTIDDDPRPGAWGHTVAFLHPASTGGVLVEFVEH